MKQSKKIKKSLRYSILDGSFWAIMFGFGERYLAAFAVFLKATNIQLGLLTSLPLLLASISEFFSTRLIDFFKQGGKLEKPDDFVKKRREQEREKRMDELEKVLAALDITEEDRYVKISFKTQFKTDFIYDDFQLLRVKREIQDLIKKEFQISEPFKVKIIKKL